jgi:hypothetical protein
MENGYVEIKLTDMPHAFDCVCRLKADRNILKIQYIFSDFRGGLINCSKKYHIRQTMLDSKLKCQV